MKDNKLIAEFMGWTPCDPNDSSMYANPHDKSDAWSTDEMRFNESWDLLMPVVREVIIRHQVDEGIEIDYDELQNRVMDNDIERAYEEVVEFIKQYNVDNADSEDDACDMLYGVDNNQ